MSQAEMVYFTAKGCEGKEPYVATMHHVVRELRIGSWNSHKYLSDKNHSIIDEMVGAKKGEGCYGYWHFPDGSRLCVICGGEKFVIQEDSGDFHIVK